MSADLYLFEKMFLQCAHIAILEEAISETKLDLKVIKARTMHNSDVDKACDDALEKIDIAHRSADVLKKKGTM